ncbi:MAG: ABC transporter ATP-binding protein [Clostridia bacterium]|nr:ABC transporter ATP-binding protein [Clostridia bacterium]
MENLLEIRDLEVSFGGSKNRVNVIRGLNIEVKRGETLGIVGESGSGKSVTSLAVMGLLPPHSSHIKGEVMFEGENLLAMSSRALEKIRGNKIAMIFQEPMTSLNPIQTCGSQIMEPLMLHLGMKKKEAAARALELLKLCGISAPEQRMKEYPHQMSGGMRQRVMIAIALACNPSLLIADEPTTALDVTIQAQILELMKELKSKINMSIMMITHDLGIVADSCDRVVIMYTGQIFESAPTAELFADPLHPYTKGLLNAIPMLDKKKDRLESIDGMVPDADKMPRGCRFHPRCTAATEKCKNAVPRLTKCGENRYVRCFLFSDEAEETL